MLVVALVVGVVIGLSLGALGGGGSILTVPALVYLLGQSPHAATTGSLLIVGTTALAGAVAHHRAGRVRLGQGLAFAALGAGGALVGSRLSARVDPHVLLVGFSALILVASGAMVRRSPARTAALAGPGGVALLDGPAGQRACRLPSPGARFDSCRLVKIAAVATGVGLLTGFFGVGGGFVVVPALVVALGFEMPVAVGTSLLVIAANSAVALAARLGGPLHLDWPLLAVFTGAAVAGSVAGNRVASKVDAARLNTAFVTLLVLVALYTASRSLPHLV